MIALAIVAAKAKAAALAAHSATQMAGIMLDAENPPLCTNILHNEIDCAHSDLPREKWCDACRKAYGA